MSTNSKLAAVVASAGILAAGWSVGTAHGATQAVAPANPTTSQTTTSGTPATSSSTTGTASSTATGASSSTTGTRTTTSTTSAYKDGTYTGTTVTHRYGTVTVTVTITGGKITNVASAVVDDGQNKSIQINARALPTIKANVIAANSARVSTVSGATYTTGAYLTSLQAALAKAK